MTSVGLATFRYGLVGDRGARAGASRRVKLVAVALGVFIGLLFALGRDLPSGDALRAILVYPQIRVDLTSGESSALCVCSVPTDYRDIPQHLVRALVAFEDRRFFVHSGVDWLGIGRAILKGLTSGEVQGGSTITQQLAKNMVVGSERYGAAGIFRKVREAIVARRISRIMSKREVLAAYLNTADFGRIDGRTTWGIEAAARKYYGKTVKNLSLYESAQLVAILGATSAFSPVSNPDASSSRTRAVLQTMIDVGYIRQSEAKTAVAKGAERGSIEPLQIDGRYFTDAAVSEIRRIIGDHTGTIRLTVTLDPPAQRAAERVVTNAVAEGRTRGITQGALVSMRRDGGVAALVGGANYSVSQFDRAIHARRPPGSTFKTFVFLAALREGLRPDTLINDEPTESGWPRNFDGIYNGSVQLAFAFERSLNGATVQLARRVGISTVWELARSLGIHSPIPNDLSLALGSGGVSLLELTAAYGAVATEGRRVGPYLVVAAYTKNGQLLFKASDKIGERVLSKSTAQAMARLLRGTVVRGTGKAARDSSIWSAGKTGTSQDNRDAWFVGFTQREITGVWFGNDEGSPMENVTGGNEAAKAWRLFHSPAG